MAMVSPSYTGFRQTPPFVALRLRKLVSLIRDGTSHKADDLAVILNTSPRTIYRDISLLRRHGWDIPGEAGVGYIFKGQGSFDVLSVAGA